MTVQCQRPRPKPDACPLSPLTQDETISFYMAAERTMANGEVLIGYVEAEGSKTVLNPMDKAARVISCAHVDVLLTIAGGRGNA